MSISKQTVRRTSSCLPGDVVVMARADFPQRAPVYREAPTLQDLNDGNRLQRLRLLETGWFYSNHLGIVLQVSGSHSLIMFSRGMIGWISNFWVTIITRNNCDQHVT